MSDDVPPPAVTKWPPASGGVVEFSVWASSAHEGNVLSIDGKPGAYRWRRPFAGRTEAEELVVYVRSAVDERFEDATQMTVRDYLEVVFDELSERIPDYSAHILLEAENGPIGEAPRISEFVPRHETAWYRCLGNCWSTIERVAQRLLENGTLDHDTTAQILQEDSTYTR